MRSRNQRSWLMTTAQPAKFSKRLFQRPHGVDVEIVGRLVEEDDVAALLQHPRQVHAVAFAAGEHARPSSADRRRRS